MNFDDGLGLSSDLAGGAAYILDSKAWMMSPSWSQLWGPVTMLIHDMPLSQYLSVYTNVEALWIFFV